MVVSFSLWWIVCHPLHHKWLTNWLIDPIVTWLVAECVFSFHNTLVVHVVVESMNITNVLFGFFKSAFFSGRRKQWTLYGTTVVLSEWMSSVCVRLSWWWSECWVVVMTVVSQWGEQPMNIFRVSRKLCTEYRSTCIIYIRVYGIDRTSHFFRLVQAKALRILLLFAS